jgi:hypothetical protein
MNSNNWVRRYAVALHKGTPITTLYKLEKYPHHLVQLAATENLQSRA